MQWGDVPAWIAIVISVAAAADSWRTRRRQREANAEAATVEMSLQRIADNMERDRVGHDRLLTTLRSGRPIPTPDPPRPEFNVEYVRGSSYRLRNVSAASATHLRAFIESTGPQPSVARGLPEDIDLAPMQSTSPFLAVGSWGSPTAGELVVGCDELEQPVRVPFPPKP